MTKDLLAKLVLTGLGTGHLRPAPGTWGSAAVCAIYLAVMWCGGRDLTAVNAVLAAILLLSSVGCVAFGRDAERIFGKKDPSQCVIDEWAGQALALLALPLHSPIAWSSVLAGVGIAFVAFRVFDIIKPPPARQLESLPFGWGVLLDDLAAGVYANIVCQLVLRLGLHLT